MPCQATIRSSAAWFFVVAATGCGAPDATRTEVVTAFVVLATGVQASASLIAELQQHVRSRLGGHQYPRQVHFVKELPLTITGKIIRGQLRMWAIDAKSAPEQPDSE